MVPQVSDVLDAARGHLADTDIAGGEEFTDAVLLPGYKDAYDKLVRAGRRNGVPLKERTITATITAGETSYTPPATGQPYLLEERGSSSEEWMEVVAVEELRPTPSPSISFKVYEWSGGNILLPAALADREIRLRYQASDAAPTSGSVGIDDSLSFLGRWTAYVALAPREGQGANAQRLKQEALEELDEWVNDNVRQMQTVRYRRKRFPA